MSFWFDVLFDDEEGAFPGSEEDMSDGSDLRMDVAKLQVQHWLDRNSRMCDKARRLLKDYAENHAHKPPGNLAPVRPLAWNWMPEGSVDVPADVAEGTDRINPVWKPDEADRFEQDRAYGRVSREIDTWWLRARDPNYEEWVVLMPSVDFAQARTENCKANLVHRYAQSYRGDQSPPPEVAEEVLSDHDQGRCPDECQCQESNHDHADQGHDALGSHSRQYHHLDLDNDNDHDYAHDYVEDMIDDDEADDDVSYGEGPLTGLLTEIPNILDPKQIEALHMIVKSCILDSAGFGLTRAGENLQKTRCRMFLALDCGKSLLRELLVFIAVWDKDEHSLVFQVTTQIVEAIHHSALIPYAWNSLRIPKDVISPAQTVLLRMVNHMLQARGSAPATQELKGSNNNPRDITLVHFFFSFFRSRIVPECAALMHLQAQIREQNIDPAEFPVDIWDMERAKDGLVQYLDFLTTVAEMPDTRAKLIEWEAVYDLVTILTGLEAGVQKKALIELPRRAPRAEANNPMVERPYSTGVDSPLPSPPPPPLQEPAHRFPWAGIKSQIFTIIATLLQPPAGRSSPGNAQVQKQMVKYNGIVPLLNCCAYDDHNPYAKERVTICLKWLLDGCEAANNFFRELVSMTPQPNLKPPPPGGTTVSTIRVDGIQGEVKVQLRSTAPQPGAGSEAAAAAGGPGDGRGLDADLLERAASLSLAAAPAASRGSIEDNFMA